MSSPAFDSTAWKAGKGKHTGSENTRSRLVDGASAALKSGMSRQDVEALLGAPDEMNRQFVYGEVDSREKGKSRTIYFDASGKVIPQSPELTKGVDGTGMTPNQVKAIIGEPTTIRDDYTYYLGSPGMAPDPEYLHVLFDAEGRVIRHSRTSG